MSTPEQSHDITSSITLEAIWRNRKQIAICLCVTLSLGVAYLVVSSPKYQVTARLLVDERGKPLDAAAASEKDFLPTQAEIIRSPTVISSVVEVLALPPLTASGKSQVISILDRLEVEPLLGTNVLSIAYDDADPSLAVQTVNAVIESYKGYLKSSEQASHRETVSLLTEREKAIRAEMGKLHGEYEQLRISSPLMGQDRDSAGVQRAMLMTLGESLTTVKRRQIELKNDLSTLTTPRDSRFTKLNEDTVQTSLSAATAVERPNEWRPTIDMLSRMAKEGLIGVEDPTPLQASLLAARSREAELSTRFGPKHPEVNGVKQLIRSLESRLINMVEAAPQLLETELATLQRKEQCLAELYSKEFKEAKHVDSFLVKQQLLLDEIQAIQTTHDTLVSQLNMFELADQAVTEGRASVTVSVLDGPELVNDLVWPQPIPLLGLCGMIGILCGIVLVGVRQQLELSRLGGANAEQVSQV